MAFGGLGGLAFVGQGYDQGAEFYWRRKALEDAAAGRAALGRSLSQLTPSPMPGAMPMQPQPQLPTQPTALQGLTPGEDKPPPPTRDQINYLVGPGQMPMARPVVLPQNPSMSPSPGIAIPQGGFGSGAGPPTQTPAPPPGPPQPRVGGGVPSMPQQGPMTWQDIAHAVIRANPQAPPEVIMEAVSQAMPLMQADSRVWWQALQAELQRERMTNQSNIAQSRIDEDWAKANLSANTRRELTEKGILSRETIASEREAGVERGQDIRAATAAAGQETTRRGQDIRATTAEQAEGGREMRSARAAGVQERGQDIRAATAQAGREAQVERQKIGIEAQRQRQETAEMSKNIRFGLTLEARRQQFDQQFTEKKREFDEKLTASKAKLDKNEISDDDVHNVALAIANNRQAPYTGVAARSGAGLRVMSEVYKLKPDYDATKWRARNDAVTRFMTGKQGDTARSLKVADSHLETLTNLARALGNGDAKSLNAVKNFIADQLGYPAPASFDAARQIVAAEVIKAVSAAGGGVKERLEAAAHIDRNSSLQSILGAVTTYRMLLGGQIDGFKQQYERATGNKDFDEAFGFKANFNNKFPGQRSENTNDWQVREVASDITPEPVRPGQQYAMNLPHRDPQFGAPGGETLPAIRPGVGRGTTQVEVPAQLGRGGAEHIGQGSNVTVERTPRAPDVPITPELARSQQQLDRTLARGQQRARRATQEGEAALDRERESAVATRKRSQENIDALAYGTPQLMSRFKGHAREEEFLNNRLEGLKRVLSNYGEGPAKKGLQTEMRSLRARLKEIELEENPMSEKVYRQP